MLAHQESLPRLPVPRLQETLTKYLRSLKALVDDNEYQSNENIVKEFGQPGGIGDKLTKMIQQKAKTHDSWLHDWWMKSEYLDPRYPICVHTSPAFLFPKRSFRKKSQQIEFAAKMIIAIIEFYYKIKGEDLPVDKSGKHPVCMVQYTKLFYSCRIPGKTADSIAQCSPEPGQPEFIVVVHNNHFFAVEVAKNDQIYSREMIEQQLNCVFEKSWRPAPPIGVLTTSDRDSWFKSYDLLMKDQMSAESIEKIQKSMFMLCFDQDNSGLNNVQSHLFMDNDDGSRNASYGQMLHGGGSTKNTPNRWFDKTLQASIFIINSNGDNGLIYEHSECDGTPVMNLVDYILSRDNITENEYKDTSSNTVAVKDLNFNVDNDTITAIKDSILKIDKLITSLNLRSLNFKDYGKNFIKSQSLSPDSFFQTAMQIAFYRIHSRMASTYESGSTRLYLLGRTETIRSASLEAKAFAEAAFSDDIEVSVKRDLLKQAIVAHKKLASEANVAQGWDRHFLGMKMAAEENLSEMPKLFTSSGFVKSFFIELSTSQVPFKHPICMSFGPVNSDCYGIGYNLLPDNILFICTTFNDSTATNLLDFAEALQLSLAEMKKILTQET
ncbi:uncharacterized protein TRIADDRAFT_21860 [Trichoplax adhaerens]|uniref:Choline/carnitine acyltransferase domain-containing protein n=1 Tax=Trichoplax adhaerens TaxID=10228 RepID=B3RPC2_TRIAD|nr:hypothetical protein TRIADDRAFT_21860 [Trichoplax adhaerens]EDV28163.1 hypothetical protein TRIADDRAFT_21860 [Trichoplax adhaerens]|eukprot:XP_002109997.1 hypothetical protein TRIADDRAFT_21860 [Trichoplax adhaerens]